MEKEDAKELKPTPCEAFGEYDEVIEDLEDLEARCEAGEARLGIIAEALAQVKLDPGHHYVRVGPYYRPRIYHVFKREDGEVEVDRLVVVDSHDLEWEDSAGATRALDELADAPDPATALPVLAELLTGMGPVEGDLARAFALPDVAEIDAEAS